MFGPDDDDLVPTTPDATELAEPVRRRFLVIVVLLNLGILAVSVGILLAVFRAEYTRSVVLVGAGAAVLLEAYRRYRTRHEAFARADALAEGTDDQGG